uniref:Protein SHORT HYPOCOTYL IN WHITE LIGHT 1 n=1 Tax=Noccaea caerulescens TaxID=107243 RepID=A0A1J3ID30_NOCCA
MPFPASISSPSSLALLSAHSRSPLSFFIFTPKTLISTRTRIPGFPFASRRPREFINGRDDDVADDNRSWNRKIRPEYRYDEDYEGEEDEDDQEEEDRSLDLLLRFVENVFRKVSKRARKAVRSILPVSISTKLVGFSVNGVLILAFLWILKAFLEVACTLGTIVFTSILLIRGLWAGVAYIQESRNNRINEFADDPRAWNGVQPVS